MARTNPTRLLAAAILVLFLGPAACEDEPASRPGASRADSASAEAERNNVGRVYERRFVFTSPEPDSTVVVPFFFSARTVPGGVQRSVSGWLARGEEWDPFVEERWETPPSRAPWRILPRGPLRLIVGQEDAVEAIVYDADPRRLELRPGPTLVEWTGSRGETFNLREGALSLASRRLDGYVLDVSRGRGASDPAHGDWAFLVSGDSLHVVLTAPEEGPENSPGAMEGFGRLDFREIRWPEVSAAWPEIRAFERARRDVPMSWRVSTPGGELDGVLEVVSVELAAGGGEGPVLPVEGLYVVRGTLRVLGAEYPVRGLVRHRRG